MGFEEVAIDRIVQTLESSVPFFVGVVGHRQLRPEEIPGLQQEFDAHIQSLLKKLRNTRIIVLTGNAEGADWIPQASKLRDQFSICAVLPFAKDEYVKDFPTKKQRAEFDQVLNQCDYVLVSPHSPTGKVTGKLRDKAYKECARWISDNSNLLIGFWDGMESKGVGGTSETISYRTSDEYTETLVNERQSDFLHVKASNGERNFKQNCTCAGHGKDNKKQTKLLYELENLNNLVEIGETNSEKDQLKRYFNQFDGTASMLQKRFNRKNIALFTWAFLALQFAFIQQRTFSLFWLTSSSLALMITLLIWWSLWKSQIKSAYETFRFVAELLRIQIWWNECGLKVNVLSNNIEYHEIGDSTYLMVRNVFVFSEIAKATSDIDAKQKKTRKSEKVETKWIEGQINYLIGNKTKKGAIDRNRNAAKRGLIFMVLSFVLAGLIQILSTISFWFNLVETGSALDWTIKLVFPFLISIAAPVSAYAKLMGYKEVKILYDLKLRRLEIALEQLNRLEPSADSGSIVKSVGSASLTESLRWFQIKGDREVRPFQS
jgi:hypothetical protein